MDLPGEEIVEKGRLGPGQMIAVDLEHGRLLRDEVVKTSVASRRPYGAWLLAQRRSLAPQPFDVAVEVGAAPSAPVPRRRRSPARRRRGRRPPAAGPCDPGDLLRRQAAAGFTAEDVELIVRPMARQAREPRFSMGNDAPLPILSGKPHVLYDYFTERFAQVTNPAIDPLRERLVMSLAVKLGPRGDLLAAEPEHARQVELPSPVVNEAEMAALAGAGAARGPGLDRIRGRERAVGPAGGRRARLPRGGRRGARRRGGRRPQRPRPAAGPRLEPRAAAARRRRRAPRPDPARPAQPRLARRRDGAVLERPPLRLPHRLRRLGRAPVSRLRDRARPLGARPAQRRRAGRGEGDGALRRPAPPTSKRRCATTGSPPSRAAQDPLQDGHLAAGQLPRRAAVRGRRPRPRPHRAGVPRHAVAHRRPQRGGARPGDGVDPPAGVPGAQRREAPGLRLRPLPAARRIPPQQPGGGQDAAPRLRRGAARPVPQLQREARAAAADGAARPAAAGRRRSGRSAGRRRGGRGGGRRLRTAWSR